jgi:hypothetical protein
MIESSGGASTTPAGNRITRLPARGPGGLHSAVRAGDCATPTSFAARAGVEATHALRFKSDHSAVDLSMLTPLCAKASRAISQRWGDLAVFDRTPHSEARFACSARRTPSSGA